VTLTKRVAKSNRKLKIMFVAAQDFDAAEQQIVARRQKTASED
jgi:hypothetical protein